MFLTNKLLSASTRELYDGPCGRKPQNMKEKRPQMMRQLIKIILRHNIALLEMPRIFNCGIMIHSQLRSTKFWKRLIDTVKNLASAL